MKRKSIVRLMLLCIAGTFAIACKDKKLKHSHADRVAPDTSLNYLLQPVNEQVVAAIPVIQPTTGSSIYTREIQGRISYDTRKQINLSSRVSGRIEKLYIKYNYQPVKKGELILEIYSPDLAAAQRELLLLYRSANEDQLLKLAKQKLMLLGMHAAQINKVLKTGEIAYRIPVYSNATGFILEKQVAVAASASAPSMENPATANASVNPLAEPMLLREGQYLNAGQSIFTIYQASGLVAEFSLRTAEASQLSRQDKVIIQRMANPQETLTGKIGLIQPVFNAGENFLLARVYLKNSGLQVGELITGHLPFVAEKTLWVPKEAVISLGNKSVVFKKEGKVFVPKTVKTGIIQNKQVQLLDEVSGWEIAKNAYYLIDSESFIKTKPKGI